MAALRVILAGFVLIMLAGCLPVTTETPVGTTAGLGIDDALVGVWKGRMLDNKAMTYLTFLKEKDDALTAVLVTPTQADESGGWGAFTVQTAKLGASTFINAREIHQEDEALANPADTKTFPLLYRFSGKGKLTLYLLDEKLAADAVKSGRIAGRVESGANGDVTITAKGPELDAFMQSKEGLALFTALSELTRVE